MKIKYKEWIDKHVGRNREDNAEITLRMQSDFSELRRVRGYYYDATGRIVKRWWLVDENGDIVDPTACQMPSLGTGSYVAWDDENVEPSGTCLNCGNWRYDGNWFCGDPCRDEYIDAVMMSKWSCWLAGRD